MHRHHRNDQRLHHWHQHHLKRKQLAAKTIMSPLKLDLHKNDHGFDSFVLFIARFHIPYQNAADKYSNQGNC